MKSKIYLTLMIFIFTACEKSDQITEPKYLTNNPSQQNPVSASKKYVITILTEDNRGKTIDDIYLYVDDGYACYLIASKKGKATITVQSKKIFICAWDKKNRKKYGIIAKRYSSASTKNTIQLPAFPKTALEAGKMIDSFVKTSLESINLYLDLREIWQTIKVIRGFKLGGLSKPGGVPGVFSISALPTTNSQGQFGLGVSGILIQEIFKYIPTPAGKYNYYSANPGY